MNEEELDPRDHLAAIINSADDAIISKDLNGLIRSFNGAAERMFGYKAAEIVGKPVLTLIPADRQSEETEILARLRRGERIDHFETVRQRKDGSPIEISLTISPVRNSNGVIVGASKIAHDITEQKRTAQILAEQREWFRVTLNSIGDAVIATDREGRITFMNDVAARETGWSFSEAEGSSLEAVFTIYKENTRRRVQNPVIDAVRDGAVVTLTNHTILVARDGSEHPIEASAAPIRDQSGQILGAILVFHDITARRHAEREVAAALAREQAARKDAEVANRMKDEFLATLSHELRTPLSAITGWAAILRQGGCTDDERKQGLDAIDRNARAQARLIEDLLDMSRILSGKLQLDVRSLDMAMTLDAAIDAVFPSARGKEIHFQRDVESGSLAVHGDAARLQQICTNLLTNAVKFTPRGGSVRVSARRTDSDVVVEVSDTGMGIEGVFLPHIFERFRQADSSTTRHHGGLGLGLSITRQLVELHGGTITAASEGKDKGATFTVRLPLSAVLELPPAGAGGGQEEFAGLEGLRLNGMRVLVVDDEPDARDVLGRVLEERGATVDTAGSAAEAITLMTTSPPDVLVSDIGMPDADGYTLIRAVRAMLSERGGRVPAVALSAFVRSEDRLRALLAGFQVHISKPVEPVELVAVLANLASPRER